MRNCRMRVLATLAIGVLAACGGDEPRRTEQNSAAAPATNRIDLPLSVRQNLGITWAEARQGHLERVVALPGEVVARPDRTWEFHAPLAGTVTSLARPWQAVEAGTVVARIASPALAELQSAILLARERAVETSLELARVRAEVEPERALRDARTRAAQRAKEALGRQEELRSQAADLAAAAARRLAEVEGLRKSDAVSAAGLLVARREALEAARVGTETEKAFRDLLIESSELALAAASSAARTAESQRRIDLLTTKLAATEAAFDQQLLSLAALIGMSAEELNEEVDGTPRWARLRELDLRAPARGVAVEVQASAGAWVERDARLVRIIDPTQLMFRAHLPEADAARIPDGAAIRVTVPGVEGRFEAGAVAIRPLAEGATRSLLLEGYLDNAQGLLRGGNSATALVVLGEAASEEVLIPTACVVRDGLESIVFVRDPANEDRVVRTIVTLGRESGGEVEVIAGVGVGDRLVRDGVHQLRETGLGQTAAGGHFHADGTWHAGDE